MSNKLNKEKRILKREPRLGVDLTPEQKEVARLFQEFDIVFIIGDFGTGKTLTAVHTALTAFRKKQFNRIWLTRPMLKNNLAALPGTLEEKLRPYTFPLVQNIELCQGKNETEKMKNDSTLEIMPVEVAKGVTAMDCVFIVDEFQDVDYQDFRTLLTRLGKDSKMIFCGSKQQIDRSVGDKSCFHKIEKLKDSGLVGWVELVNNNRNPALTRIIEFLEK